MNIFPLNHQVHFRDINTISHSSLQRLFINFSFVQEKGNILIFDRFLIVTLEKKKNLYR